MSILRLKIKNKNKNVQVKKLEKQQHAGLLRLQEI